MEIFAAESSRIPLGSLQPPQPGVLVDATNKVHIAPTPNGKGAVMTFPDAQVKHDVLDSILVGQNPSVVGLPDEQVSDESSEPTTQSLEAYNQTAESGDAPEDGTLTLDDVPYYTDDFLRGEIQSFGQVWRHISLMNPVIRLAVGVIPCRFAFTFALISEQVVRRFTQLTGQRVPDHILQNTSSVGYLVSQLAQPQKPNTLYEALTMERQEMISLPNVQISHRRETPVDKEKRVGRWKVIEGELRSKGLPVPGRT